MRISAPATASRNRCWRRCASSNAKADGLGMPLPAGRVRMFDGNDFLGEASLGAHRRRARTWR